MFLLDLIEGLSATHEPRHINFDVFDRVVRGSADMWEVMADLQWEERFRYALSPEQCLLRRGAVVLVGPTAPGSVCDFICREAPLSMEGCSFSS